MIDKQKLDNFIKERIERMPNNPEDISTNAIISIQLYFLIDALEKLILKLSGDKFDYGA